MKKLILTIFLMISLVKVNAQCDLLYKPLSAFGTDTTAFIIYNFMDRADCYKGKTIKEVEIDLQMPIKDYVNIVAEGFAGLCLYLYDLDEMNNIRKMLRAIIYVLIGKVI